MSEPKFIKASRMVGMFTRLWRAGNCPAKGGSAFGGNPKLAIPCPVRQYLLNAALVGMLGIEPSLHAPEACVLPVYYIPARTAYNYKILFFDKLFQTIKQVPYSIIGNV